MILSLDIGSRRIGAVLAAPVQPLVIVRHATIRVDPDDLDPTIALIDASLDLDPVTAILVEHNTKVYMPTGKPWQSHEQVARQHAAIAAAHEVCSRLYDRIHAVCKARGIPMHTIQRNAWSHRVVQHHQGGVSDAQANDGLRALLAPEEYAKLVKQDERDACGALLGWIINPPDKIKHYKYRDRRKDKTQPRREPLTAEQRKENLRTKQRAANGNLERLSTNVCNCGPGGTPRPASASGRHGKLCPCATPPRYGRDPRVPCNLDDI